MENKMNILNKQGLLSDEDRKKPLVHACDYVTFQTCLDLSQPIKMIPHSGSYTTSLSHIAYSREIANFICWWTYFVHKDLNGFSGFSNVIFEPVGFKII